MRRSARTARFYRRTCRRARNDGMHGMRLQAKLDGDPLSSFLTRMRTRPFAFPLTCVEKTEIPPFSCFNYMI